jgi:lipopolysaccharide export system protein LptA
MDKRRFLQLAFTTVFALFLLVLVFKFKPRVDVPTPAPPGKPRQGPEGQLAARGFRYVQETSGRVDFVITADRVTESSGGLKVLTTPVVTFPNQGKAWGKSGSFNPHEKTFRVWDDAHISQPEGWTASSTGFRLTPEGEIVSEGPVVHKRKEVTGEAELLRYNRNNQQAHLEGTVRFIRADQSMACKIIDLDMAGHSGNLVGPVRLASDQGTITAPSGSMVMDAQNHLKNLSLAGPCTGRGTDLDFSCARLTAFTGPNGELSDVDLAQDVVVSDKRTPPSVLRTQLLHLVPSEKPRWNWTAPGSLSMAHDGGVAQALSGAGSFGGQQAPTAELAGPVRGKDPRGTFAGDRAKMSGGDWTLIGHAMVNREEEHLAGDRILWRQDGSSSADGSVSGGKRAGERPELRFTSERAEAGPGGYPAHLTGDVRASRGDMTLAAPSVTLQDDTTALASGGAVATFKDAKGAVSTVKAPDLDYSGAKRLATAKGGARGEGKDYWITASVLTAHLDDHDLPVSYEAEGDAKFSGTLYEGHGDHLTYDPATQGGQARGIGSDAVVVQKTPYRRLAGPVVDFAPKRLQVMPGEESSRRGHLEGLQEKQESKPQPTQEGAGNGH